MTLVVDTSPDELDSIAATAAEVAPTLAAMPPRQRAAGLLAVADALDQAGDDLVPVAMAETGLSEPRLRGELRRTTVQLRLFAEVAADGSFLDVRIDEVDPDFAIGPRPDVRRYLAAVGPVLNFAASNFPFAFSVPGGDTAAALTGGNPVVVKVHPGHPQTSVRVAEAMSVALDGAGYPAGALQLVFGQQPGVDLLQDRRIRAACFTGSVHAGRLLADIAAARPDPIAFYGELGSVNPVVVTPAAAASRATDIADGFVTSVSGSAGQLCTKPGFLLVPAGSTGLTERIAEQAAAVGSHRLLHPGIAAGYTARRETILGAGVSVLAEGSVEVGDDGLGWATPTVVLTSLLALRADADALIDEAFGPLSVVVEYTDLDDVTASVADLFPGNLTAGLQIADAEPAEPLQDLVTELAGHAGRVLVNGWPTGVAVTPAMQHGGPYPSATAAATSVGTDSVGRFLRGVAFQNMPQALLPPPLQDDNPWGVPQHRSPAGASRSWGTLRGVDATG